MPTPRRLSDFQVQDTNGLPLQALALKLGTGNAVLTAAVASSAEIALPGAGVPQGAGNLFLISTQGPMSIRFGTTGMAAAGVDNTSQHLPVAGLYLCDAGLLATFFRHIRAGAADVIFQIMAIPTQA